MEYDETINDFYLVMILPLIFSSFNLLGALYIFSRTFSRWKYDRKSFSLSCKIPFYIAITDFLYSSTIIINFSYSASNKSKFLRNEIVTWPSPYCEIVGFFSLYFVALNILLVGSISVITWLRVVKEYYFELGRWDYKIWSPAILISLTITLSTEHSFGSLRFWCAIKTGYNQIGILFFILIILTLITIIFCYAHVLKTIRDIKRNLSDSQSDEAHRNLVERKSINKVLTYITVFIIQYIPILAFNICRFLELQVIILDALCPAAVCFGGIANLIQYIYNEGLRRPDISCLEDYKYEVDEQQKQINNNSIIV